jgi:SAM-dependent methyltransferase
LTRLQQPKLYSELASWWPLMSAPGEYREEAEQYAALLTAASQPEHVLELGSGGGNSASHLKKLFRLTLVDLSPEMLEVSRTLNPECNHHPGDMRNVRLGTLFDAVFIHDALSYLTTADDLLRALATAFEHCRPGGATLLAPDGFRETFEPSCGTGGHDAGDRSLRYLEWTYDPDPSDTTVERDFAFILRSADAPTGIVGDHHTCGLFGRELWLDLCRKTGFEPGIQRIRHTDPKPFETEVILCRKPA